MPKCATGWAMLLLLAASACAPAQSSQFPVDSGREELTPVLAGTGAFPTAGEAGTRNRVPSDIEDFRPSKLPVDSGVTPPMAAEDTSERVELAPRCASDQRGNWVCVWPVGQYGSGGPCAFGADSAVSVASQIVAEDNAVTAQLGQFDTSGRAI